MPGQHDIYIFYDKETKAYDVYPKVAVFTKGARMPVKFKNLEQDQATLVLPAGLFAAGQPSNVPGSGAPDLGRRELLLDPAAEGVYDYGVIVKGMKADPKIIVDP